MCYIKFLNITRMSKYFLKSNDCEPQITVVHRFSWVFLRELSEYQLFNENICSMSNYILMTI